MMIILFLPGLVEGKKKIGFWGVLGGIKEMTVNQAAKKLRSLYYRQHLLKDLEALESEVMAYVEARGIKGLAGFKINVQNGKVRLRKVKVNSKQLHLRLKEEGKIK